MAGAEPTTSCAPSEVEQLRAKVSALEEQLGRAHLRNQKLETQLAQARAQVAWFHKTLFGQKAERVDPVEVERAWMRFLEDQERTAQGTSVMTEVSAAKSMQLLLLLGGTTPEVNDALDALASAGISVDGETASMNTSSSTPPDHRKKPKRDRHGRKRLPETLRRETIVLAPDLGAFAGDARYVETDVSYRIGVRPAEVYAIAIERPRYSIELVNGRTKSAVAEPPAEMIERGLLAPSALAHVLAMKWERHVPWSRLALFFGEHGYEIPKSTLAGVSIRAEPLAKSLVDAITDHAKKVAPYLAIDATGARLQSKDRCAHGHTWMRFIENIGVLVSFTTTHDFVASRLTTR